MKFSIGLAILLSATAASAQTMTPNQTAAAQVQAGTTKDSSTVAKPNWAPIGGFEADTHGSGYGFFGPS